jgi:NAD(P)-dependent dehydrogenase (short-subunit alcohol dehydrogenase family)
MKNKIVVITGANTGMGKVTAIALAKRGAHIVMVCRNKQKAEVARSEIQSVSGNKNVDLLIADLSLQSSIKELVGEIQKKYRQIDVLINNAGLALTDYSETAEGIETTFATNVLSMFLLTNLLKEQLSAAPVARVINVASSTHTGAKIQLDDIAYKKNYSLFGAYNQSKLCNIMLTYEQARRFASTPITVNCLNPGPVKTELARDMGAVFKLIGSLFFLSPEKASETAIYLASDKELEKTTGKYFTKSKAVPSSKLSYDTQKSAELWRICEKMTNQKF